MWPKRAVVPSRPTWIAATTCPPRLLALMICATTALSSSCCTTTRFDVNIIIISQAFNYVPFQCHTYRLRLLMTYLSEEAIGFTPTWTIKPSKDGYGPLLQNLVNTVSSPKPTLVRQRWPACNTLFSLRRTGNIQRCPLFWFIIFNICFTRWSRINTLSYPYNVTTNFLPNYHTFPHSFVFFFFFFLIFKFDCIYASAD